MKTADPKISPGCLADCLAGQRTCDWIIASLYWVLAATGHHLGSVATNDPELIDTDIVTGQSFTDGGTVTRTYTVVLPISRNTTIYVGPLALTANARAWAGYSALLGLLLLGVGVAGMLHFATQTSAPVISGDYTETVLGSSAGEAEGGGSQ